MEWESITFESIAEALHSSTPEKTLTCDLNTADDIFAKTNVLLLP